MRTVGLKVLKNKLSEYVRIAAGGEHVLISDRGKVVAELVPPNASRAESVSDALLAEAVRNGLMSPPRWRGGPVTQSKGVMKLSDVLRDLGADRGDR
jgi:prevent-host-death family protein